MPSHNLKKKAHFISLGCARNQVDAEVMLGCLKESGWEISPEPEDAGLVVINTCGFIESAKAESIDQILAMAALKEKNKNLKICVAGCLSQRYRNRLAKGLPEVDLFIGTTEFPEIARLVEAGLPAGTIRAGSPERIYTDTLPRINTMKAGSAWVKIAEGCQHQCAFCIIPAIRGPLRSRTPADILRETTSLVGEGAREINLIAQDLAAYGRDHGESDLYRLLQELVKVPDLAWIRLMYMYPENIRDELIELMAASPKIVPYVDMPVQHASDAVLQRMHRDVTREELRGVLGRLRRGVPGIAIRTSVMVGFPGETDDDFLQLRDFVEEQRFDHLGCFVYSREEGTVAGRLPDQVPAEVMEERQAEIMALQRRISADRLAAYVGREMPVLVSGVSDESEYVFEGRLATQAPDVDGVVYITDGQVRPGQIQQVCISESHDYDLVGAIVDGDRQNSSSVMEP